MKKIELNTKPICFNERESYGFDWKEHVLAIPSPIILVTTYKDNGKANATLQSWLTFSNGGDFYCIFGSVNKNGHMYKTIKQNNDLVINFPSAKIYRKCLDTIKNNQYELDEITSSNLTAIKSKNINAPLIDECFLNLECKYEWEKELGEKHVVMCVRVVSIYIDEKHLDENDLGRYDETGYLYNIHSPINPITGKEEETYLGLISKYKTYNELD